MITREADDRAWADMLYQHLSRRDVRWVCPYCTKEVPDDHTACCGEVHAEPMSEGTDEDE